MSPEDRIRQLMEENARLRSQLEEAQAGAMYRGAMSPQYQQFQDERQQAALQGELRDYEDYQRNGYYGGPQTMPQYPAPQPSQHLLKEPSPYLRKEPSRPKKRGPVGLD